MPIKNRHTHWLAVLCVIPASASAVTEITPYVNLDIHRDSNVFGYSGRQEAALLSGSTQMADTVRNARAGLEVEQQFGQQRLRASGELRHYDYQHFNQLDHDGYRWDAALDWRLGSRVNGRVDWRQERRLAVLADRNDDALALEQERLGGLSAGWLVGSQWRLEAKAMTRRLDSPLTGLPDFGLEEDSLGAGIHYLGLGRLRLGLLGEYLDGQYVGTGGADAPFEHTRFELGANYAISGLSELEARLGHTQRKDRFADGSDHRVDALTGSLGLKRVVSGVSSVNAEVFRRINSDASTPDSVVETGMRLGLQWQPTVKLGLDLSVEWLESEFQGNTLGPQQREDEVQSAFLRLNYQMRPWLGIHPYTQLRDRDSNFADERYRGNIYGLELRLRFGGALDVG